MILRIFFLRIFFIKNKLKRCPTFKADFKTFFRTELSCTDPKIFKLTESLDTKYYKSSSRLYQKI